MTKKILAALLAVMMIVSLLPATFAVNAVCPGTGFDHSKDNCTDYTAEGEYVEAGCCTPGYQLYVCNVCGDHFAADITLATEAEDCTWKLESEYVAPTCTTAGAWAKYVCEVGNIAVKYTDADGVIVAAGTAAPAALGHDFGDIVDCHEGKVCQRENCGYAEEQGKHSWEASFNYDDIVIDIEPSELQNGEFHYVCADCGIESEAFVIVYDDHVMTKVDATTPTCSAPGMREHYTCANACCAGKLYIKLSSGKYQEVTQAQLIIDAVEHTFKDVNDVDYDAWVTDIKPTCETNGFTYKKCTVCLQWIEDTRGRQPASEEYHKWTIITPAVVGTCTQQGKTELKTCSVCRKTVGGEIIEGTGLGHSNTAPVTFAGNCCKEAYSYTYCTNSFCDVAKVTTLTLGSTTLTFEGEGLRILTSSVGAKNTAVHNIGWYTTEVATCKAGGHQVEMCLDCLDTTTATGRHREIVASNEYCDFGTAPVTPATCTEQAVYKCANCGREEKRGTALGHDYNGQPTLTKSAHCEGTSGAGVDGYTYQECKRCGTEKKIADDLYNDTYIYESEDTARAQHTLPNGFKAIYVQGDCERQGLWTLGECEDCNRVVLLVDDMTGKGHVEKANSRVAPTCTAHGYYICANDHCTLPDKKVSLEALGHSLQHVAANAADCENDGNLEHYKCTRTDCGVILTASTNMTISADGLTLTLPALQYTWVVPGLGESELTDAVNGNTMTLTIGENTMDGTYTVTTAAVEYTFIIEGGKFVAALEETTASQVLPALGHDSHIDSIGFTAATLNPSNVNNCVDFAYANVMWCGRCAYSVMEGYKAATGHDFSEDEEDLIFDDCEEDGYYVCGNNCGEKSYVADSAKGHKNSDGDYFWSGCEDTEDNRHCVVCCTETGDCTGIAGKCLIPNEHDFYVLIDNAPATCTEYGYDLEVCETCGYEHIVVNEDPHNHRNGAAIVWNDYTEDGRIKGVCTLCGAEKYKEGISFEVKIDNANAAGAGYTESSLIEVTVNLCASIPNTELRGFNFCLISEGVVFVDYEYVNEDFDIYAVTTPENALNNNGVITVNGMASNNRLGEKQNVAVAGKNAVIKLYFRVVDDAEVSFYIPSIHEGDAENESAWLYNYNADADKIEKSYSYGGAAYSVVKEYMDITIDGAVTMTDVLEAYEMISNPDEGESTYNVVMDVNKDGSVTLLDLQAIMEFLSNNADLDDMLTMGISAEELTLLEKAMI